MDVTWKNDCGFRDGKPAWLAAAQLDPAAWRDLDDSVLDGHLQALVWARFDLFLMDATAAEADAGALQRLQQAAERVRRTLVVRSADGNSTNALEHLNWNECLVGPVADPQTEWSPGRIALAAGKCLVRCRGGYATGLLSGPVDPRDALVHEQRLEIFHRMNSFFRKQGEWLVRAEPQVFAAGSAEILEQPARVELSLLRLENRPVWGLVAVNPTPYSVDGRLRLVLDGRELDLGRLQIRPERFQVQQISFDHEPKTRLLPDLPDLPRKKGLSKPEWERRNRLQSQRVRVRMLLRGLEF